MEAPGVAQLFPAPGPEHNRSALSGAGRPWDLLTTGRDPHEGRGPRELRREVPVSVRHPPKDNSVRNSPPIRNRRALG